jgi:hypothetical protein
MNHGRGKRSVFNRLWFQVRARGFDRVHGLHCRTVELVWRFLSDRTKTGRRVVAEAALKSWRGSR